MKRVFSSYITRLRLLSVTLFDNDLLDSRAIVRAQLENQGFSGLINTTSPAFTKNNLQSLKSSENALPNIDSETISNRKFNVKNLIKISDNHVKVKLGSDECIDEAVTDILILHKSQKDEKFKLVMKTTCLRRALRYSTARLGTGERKVLITLYKIRKFLLQ
ncbi:hypothetical protein Glove_155g22 [Diversispora epigaea]|uniref:Uncharacterized protein n=1 Tax=Diversispora epigaea TaxID=1348612 RepID=A0A397IS57_9GLOM|nr:hypothetical protein Glove_155g22 [Diversispora epigaea]